MKKLLALQFHQQKKLFTASAVVLVAGPYNLFIKLKVALAVRRVKISILW
jgi:hypothetical protein